MTKFEDRLFERLIAEHGHQLRAQPAPPPPAPARRRAGRRAGRWARRPVWLATAAAAVTAAATAAVMAAGSTPALAAYAVTRHDGTVTVSVYRLSGVAGANAALHAMHAPVVVVPVRPSCPPIGSLPRPRPAPHPAVWVNSGVGNSGHRSVTVKINGGIPHADTMILAFTGNPHTGGAVGAGGIITGPVPHCVSLPPPPPGGSSGS
jgi:hypothetical protein